jgi:glycerol-3-phosphate dehydrogenase
MKRDPRALEDVLWDVLVIGGGIHGACVAWDAVLRGLTVCLVDKADFGSATSANTMKIVHGGLRYLQHADYRRMRESIGERRSLLRIAPHLVHPLPIVVPTYGHGWRGREVLRAALLLNDLIGLGRNTGLDDAHRIPRGRTVSRRECLRLAPGLAAAGVTGAAIFHDAQVYNSERLVLALLRSAAKAGAELTNYAEVTGLARDGGGLVRVVVSDRLSDERFSIRARTVVNASGPWVDHVLGLAGARLGTSFARAFNVVTRPLFATHAVALPMRHRSGDGGGGDRLLFVVPWRGQSLVGTWYEPHDGRPGDVRITEADVARLLGEINRRCPALALTLDDVRLVHGGLLPLTETELARHGRIVDHARDGLPGVLSVVGVKYTTARLMAERVVDRVFEWLGRTPSRSVSAVVPLDGPAHGDVLADLSRDEHAEDPVALLRAEVRHAIRAEMAQTLSDVVFRRTELGTAGDPGRELLVEATRTAADELGWSRDRERLELRQVYGRFGVPR